MHNDKNIPIIINKKYIVETLINSGTFSNVFKVTYNNKYYAIKNEITSNLLKHEQKIYKELNIVNNISNIIDFFKYKNVTYMVLDYYEDTLISFKIKHYNSKDYNIRISKIFSTIIKTISDVHNCGIVHRDLKPNNICLDLNDNPYIIDFGLAKKIIYNKKHIEQKMIHSIIGNDVFVSVNVKNLIEPSRRDDIESILYILIYMLLELKIEKDFANIKHIDIELYKFLKSNLIKNEFIINEPTNLPINIINMFIYTRKMKFTQTPNYEYIIKTLFLINL